MIIQRLYTKMIEVLEDKREDGVGNIDWKYTELDSIKLQVVGKYEDTE